VLYSWKKKYPTAIIQGHRDFSGVNKACPSFDAKKEYASVG
jgi:N-acetylmuramoyl-L-alanine amidase